MFSINTMIDLLGVINIQQLLTIGLVLIGLYAIAWWLIDNLKSIVQIVLSVMLPYFQPSEDVPLSEKYGNWAGKC